MFYQLNTITAYDFFHSSVSIEEYAKKAKAFSYGGIGIRDSNVYAFPSLAQNCQKEGLKPIFGYHISLDSSFQSCYEASLYIQNEQGYKNLCLILGEKRGNIPFSLLEQYSSGLAIVIHTNDDFYSNVYLSMISRDMIALKKIFKDNLYIGISLGSTTSQQEVFQLYDYCKTYQYQTIAFPLVKYIHKSDAYKTEILELSQQIKEDDEQEIDISREGPYFLLSEKVLEKIYRQEDLLQTQTFADKIDFVFFKKRGSSIVIDNEDEELKNLSYSGLKKKLSVDTLPLKYQERLDYELSVIKNMHFSSYFLIVEDYVRFAKKAGIKVGPGRGSAGGALVSYALDITDIDPIRFDLTFERFLNPERVTMPDIDIDFDDERRNEVVTYLKQKYSQERVCAITTFVRLKPKSTLNLIGPVLHVQENRLKRLTSSISDKAIDFEQAKKDPYKGQQFLKLYEDPYFKEICDVAQSLINLPVNTSLHAPGVIISQDVIYRSIPLKEGKVGAVAFEYPNMEALGFLKVDILALSNLSFIKHIEEKILATNKSLPDIYHDLENKKVYEVLNQLDLVDIFQLDASYGMKKTIQTMKPTCFSDLACAIALYRPGPMDHIIDFARRKNGEEKIVYDDDRLEPVLKETYGIMVYQEQIMKTLRVLASFSLAEADLFRRAISKKQVSKMEAYKSVFIKGCINNQIDEKKAEDIYKKIEKFAEYGFNKSHAYAYGLIAYTLLYYKALYPVEFYLTALEEESLSSNKAGDLLKELNKRGFVLKNPHINRSLLHRYALFDKAIYAPLLATGNSDNFFAELIKEREKGEFISFYDFVRRMSPFIQRDDDKMILSIIDSGAFDCFCKNRPALKEVLSSYIDFAHFDLDEKSVPPIKQVEVDLGQLFLLEKQIIGRILSCPLEKVFSKRYYHTFIISDVSTRDLSHIITVENEEKKFRIRLPNNLVAEKYDFVLLKGQLPYKSGEYWNVEDIIICQRKVIKNA